MTPARPVRPDGRPNNPRNTSIDSAVSSISSNASNTFKSGAMSSATMSQPPDFTSLVQAAGSAEAALYNMWKEKQSVDTHNAQLWRIVTKQKDMVIGLNKDLERALKDRERYRKKLKDHLAQVPPLPPPLQRIEAMMPRDQSQSPDIGDQFSRSSSVAGDKRETLRAAQRLASLDETSSTPARPDAASHPAAESPPIKPEDSASAAVSVKDSTSGEPSPRETESNKTAQRQDTMTRSEAATFSAPGMAGQGRDLRLQQVQNLAHDDDAISPKTPTGNGRLSNSLRKAPPAPLDFSQPTRASEHLHQITPGDVSDSDYDDVLEEDEMPTFSRGRRKTREEDDRQREILAQRELENRSQSSKTNKGKSKSKSKSQPPTPTVPIEQAPRPVASVSPPPVGFSHAPGLPSSPRLAKNPGSINALLSGNSEASPATTQRSIVAAPLMSPGLPVSPRPGDRPPGAPTPRLPKQNIASPPMSPTKGLPLSPRAPKGPLPLPPQTPLSFASPHLARAETYQTTQRHQTQDSLQSSSGGDRSNGHLTPSPELDTSSRSTDNTSTDNISRRLVSDQYPNLLLPPNALPSIEVKVFSSRLRPSRLSFMAPNPSDEDPVFILAIYARSDRKQLWRVEKTIVALPELDHKLRSLSPFNGRLPDRSLFGGHAPAKMDARRAALNSYFEIMLDTPLSENAALVVCDFFSTDAIGAEIEEPKLSALTIPGQSSSYVPLPQKEGYLTKRGKNFGGWKARYFVLHSPEFRYYEAPGGALLGSIKLQNAQIGRQNPRTKTSSGEDDMRHAFLILEPKRKDPSTKISHVLCAESDEERDAWVEALMRYVDSPEDQQPPPSVDIVSPGSARSNDPPKSSKASGSARSMKRDSHEVPPSAIVQGFHYEDTQQAEAPVRGPPIGRDALPSPPLNGSFVISAPSNGAIIQNAELWGNKPVPTQTSTKDKKRSIFGFRPRTSADLTPGHTSSTPRPRDNTPPGRHVFGIPLAEAVEYSQPAGVDELLPAVVYRCLEYLRAKSAHNEEGIFRLSGSNIVIKELKERFNTEGDIKLLEGKYYDVHAVASLLKSYLRELPVSVLTRELHLDFLKVLELKEPYEKIAAFHGLVQKLPDVNAELLRALSSFLIEITDNSDINKMNIRNVGIVFSPTLNIPPPLVSFFITDYDDIFGAPHSEDGDHGASPVQEITVTAPLTPESIRSPRHQMFSDIPTPAYSQTSFPQQQDRSGGSVRAAGPENNQDTGFIPMQPTYDNNTSQIYNALHQQGIDGYGSLNGALHPGNSRDAKAKRRESGMLLMNMGMDRGANRKSSMQRLREDAGMLYEE
ncbi:RhoGAP-domain-containing protein [Saccharata proteae CBS 121410]|uniref:RhoGAP-domain-containing protein n=1 Tax=Saccharata proteae CBS 121410 TaxID=1314787 RepID=A0A9P4I256_9PEZI|nr:RhoGAP-domain-containing protein [Saccharata proteae CBS 121410]